MCSKEAIRVIPDYKPLMAKLPAMKRKYRHVPEAVEMLASEEREMDLYRRYSELE